MQQVFSNWFEKIRIYRQTLVQVSAVLCLILVISCLYSKTSSNITAVKNLESLVKEDQPLKKFRLDNGVEVCFVQDKTQNRSSAAFAVQAGSWDDPKQAQGMAHFLEHMLFLGSESYPKEDGFSSYLSEHQGHTNAYTDSDATIYYMNCTHDGFLEGLDRFCDLIARPTFSESAIQREKNAIEEELALRKNHESYLAHLAFCQTLANDHPAKLFHIGSLETLSDIGKEALRAWHKTFYNAPSIKLTVVSPFPPSLMLPCIKNRLSVLPPREKEIDRGNKDVFWITHDKANQPSLHRITMQSTTNSYRLQLIWPLLPLSQKYYSLNTTEISNVISHQDPSGLYSYLQRKGWCKDFYAAQIGPGNRLVLICDFHLTEKGYKNKERIVQIFRAMLERHAGLKAPPAFLYQEHLHTQKQKYLDGEKKESQVLAEEIANGLLYEPLETYPSETYLRSPQIYSFIRMQCQQMLETPPVIVEIIPKSEIEKNGIELDRKHPNLPEFCFNIQNEPRFTEISSDAKSLVARFQMFPSRNPYIRYKATKQKPVRPFKLPSSFDAAVETKSLRLHYLNESFLGKNKSCFIFRISHPFSKDHSIQRVALENLWDVWITNYLQKIAHQAQRAGYHITSRPLYGEYEVKISGWTSRIKMVIDDFLRTLQLNSTDNEEEFIIAKQALITRLKNVKNDPIRWAHDQLLSHLYRDHVTVDSLIDFLQNTTAQELDRFASDYFSAVHLDITAVTPLPLEKVSSLASQWRKLFVSNLVKRNQLHAPIPLIRQHEEMFFEPTKDTGNTLFLHLEHGPSSNLDLLASMLILDAPLKNGYFDKIRTKQQMAYIASVSSYETQTQKAATLFYTSSGTFSAHKLKEKTEEFIHEFITSLQKQVSITEFISLKKALEQKLQEKPDSVDKMADLVINQLVKRPETGKVDSRALLSAVRSLEYLDWLAIVQKAFHNPKKLSMLTGLEKNEAME